MPRGAASAVKAAFRGVLKVSGQGTPCPAARVRPRLRRGSNKGQIEGFFWGRPAGVRWDCLIIPSLLPLLPLQTFNPKIPKRNQ